MDAVSRLARNEAPELCAPGRLLAVRRAGAAFQGPFALRSQHFEELLQKRDALRRELAGTRSALLDALHRIVPTAGPGERRVLLRLKRDVFNLRSFAVPPHLAPELAAELARYTALMDAEADLFSGARAGVLAEQRHALAALLTDERFRLACRYSSAGLWEAVEHGTPPPEDDFSALERGLYAYAARFASKANPLHLFADVIFPPGPGPQAGDGHEVVVDVSAILELERAVLPHLRDPRRVWLSLRPCVDRGKMHFWVAAERGFRVLALPGSGALGAVVGFFAHRRRLTGHPTGTRADCESHLAAWARSDATGAAALLDALVKNGIVEEYLVTDLSAPVPALLGAGAETDARAARLRRVHLARPDTAALAEIEAELATDPARPAYYVNSYARADTSAHVAAAGALGDDLRALAPFFCASHNFDAHGTVAEAFVLERLSEGGSAPFLDLLSPFMRELDALIARFHPAARVPAERARRAAWSNTVRAATGRLDHAALAELLPAPLPPAHPLCFNGPFDYVEGVFYPSNVWAGDGRFVSRYLLHRRRDLAPKQPFEEEVVDVELAVPPRINLNYVVRRHPTGCGFESRYAHQFERWIDPAEIVIEATGGTVGYRHAPTGVRLRIHHRGFLLAQYLPAEYQLLLIGHADTFENPFEGTDSPGSGVRHVEALHYGAVCLRRERWAVPGGALAEPLRDRDPLRRAALLRDWVHERLCAGAEHWYYRTSNARAKGYKPQFLDLRNPLGAAAFRRAVTSLPENGTVSLSPMRPGPAHLHQDNGVPYVTELMVET